MKVNIYETVEVSDERRKQIAALLGQKTATRDDLKTFIWDRGAGWEISLDEERGSAPADEFQEYVAPVTDEDLVGFVKSNERGVKAAEELRDAMTDLVGGEEDLI